MDVSQAIALVFVGAGASMLGSMLGMGGGVFLVPIFTLFFGIDEKLAIGASAVAVVTSSIVGSQTHLRSRFANLHLAMLLLITTATGAVIGALLAVNAPERILNAVFGAVLSYAAVSMLVRRQSSVVGKPTGHDPLELRAEYFDQATQKHIVYQPERLKLGMTISAGAGFLAGMLGVGGGVVQVPAMNLSMRVPVKAAAGTSVFMVGVTAVATSFVFYAEGKIDPTVVAPAIIGMVIGARIGPQLTKRLPTQRLVIVFVVILFYLGISLILKALGIDLPGQK